MSIAQLGNYTFRINPSQVFFTYDVDTAVINTIGGRVVQVYGATVGDIVVQGLFGHDHSRQLGESWRMAEQFQTAIAQLVQQQSTPPSKLQLQGRDNTPMHQPFRFVFNDDSPERRAANLPLHNWDMMVYIKSLKDFKTDYTISHETGKFSYGYTLTLFYVEDNTGKLVSNVVDEFIKRLSEGVGWQRTAFNGGMTVEDLKSYLAANSPDGTLHGLVLKQLRDTASGQQTPGLVQTSQSAAAGAVGDTGGAPASPGADPVPSAPGTRTGTGGSF